MYEVPFVDYVWASDADRVRAISDDEYVVENNVIAGIKVYGESVYVTVPRWRDGVPSSLNKLVKRTNGDILMKPFPNWDLNKKGDCTAIQFAQSMEIDPNTGYMWVIDTGRIDTMSRFGRSQNLCPAKIVIIDITNKAVVHSYEFPENVVSSTSNFLNDIVIDYIEGVARFAYISDAGDGKICVYDYEADDSYYFEDSSMKSSSGGFAPIDGIAMSSDFKYVYYSTLASHSLYAIPTPVLRNSNADFAGSRISVGRKAAGSDGMMCGIRSLFYTGQTDDSVYRVEGLGQNGVVSLDTEERVLWDSESVQWPDTLAFNGTDLWLVANKLSLFTGNRMDFSGRSTNMYIWKLGVGEHGYLWNAASRTATDDRAVVG